MERQMKKFAAGPIVLALIVALAGRASATVLTLQQCIDMAIEQSPQLSAYRHLTAADRYNVTKQRGSTMPYLSSKLSTYMVNGSPATIWTPLGISEPGIATILASPQGTVVNNNAHWSPVGIQQVGVSYPLYSKGSILGLNNPPVVAAARAHLTQDQLTAIIQMQKVMLDVSEAFLNSVSYHDQLALEQQLVQFVGEQLEITKADVGLGMTLPQQIEIVSAELEAARQAEGSARDIESNYSVQLAALIGRHEDEPFELDTRELPLQPLPSLRQFLSEVMPFHPALRVQDAKIDVAQQQVRVERASNLPTIKLNNEFLVAEDFDYFNGSSVHRRPTEFLSYITADIPIWDFGQRHAASLESTERVEYEKDLRRDVAVKIRTAIAETYGRILDDAKTVAELQSRYVSANQALLLAQAQRQEGEIDESAVVAKKIDAATAQVVLAAAALHEQLDYADLQNLSGGIWHWMQ
jgi:outer membrane protein TolC